MWSDFRSQMPVTRAWAYFDHAAVSPLPEPTRAAMAEFLADMAAHGDTKFARWNPCIEEARTLGARLLGCKPAEVALVANTTAGIALVAEGFPWRDGDNVVTFSSEFPSNLFPWMHLAGRGVEARIVEAPNERVDLNRVEDACDDRTRIIAASWVGYATGWRNDLVALAEIAHRRGGYLFVDAIQGLGVLPLDPASTGVDFLAADGHKWLLGPEGAGLFFLREEHLDLLRPIGVGWNSVQQAGNFADKSLRLKRDASRYEGGSHNMAGVVGLGASLKLILTYGVQAISERVLSITDDLCRRLIARGATIASDREESRRSGILAVELPGVDPAALKRACRQQGVALNARDGRLRLSPHAYNNDEDIERLLAAL